MMTSNPNKLIRLGDRVFNLAHVRKIEFHLPSRGEGTHGALQALVWLVGEDTPLGFEGQAAEELDEFLGGRFA